MSSTDHTYTWRRDTQSETTLPKSVRNRLGFKPELEDFLFGHLSHHTEQQSCPWKTSSDFERESLDLMAEAERLKTADSLIKPEVLLQDLSLLCEIEQCKNERELLLKNSTCNLLKKADLEKQRFETLVHALESINSHLAQIYSFLTSGAGDAQCHFTKNPSSLFREGISLYCKTDRRLVGGGLFSLLSIGQQCVVSLALSFALQAAFPCPFYFFDEFDCALDKRNTRRVMTYIRQQQNAQYFIISHKTDVVEEADGLIGISGLRHGATLVHLICESSSVDSRKISQMDESDLTFD